MPQARPCVRAGLALTTVITLVSLSGCYHRVQRALECYHDGACTTQIGMREEQFIAMMSPDTADGGWAREPLQFSQAGAAYTVYYLPAAEPLESGALVPYTFRNRRLVVIGLGQLQSVGNAAGLPSAKEIQLFAETESMGQESPDPSDSLRERGPYKWCVPDITGNGRCGEGPCC